MTILREPELVASAGPKRANLACRGTRAYIAGSLVASDFPAEELPQRMRQPGAVVWAGLDRVSAGPILRMLAPQLGLEELSIEDAVSCHERPKVDHYPGYVFVNAYLTRVAEADGRLVTSEVSAIVAPGVIITVHAGPQEEVDELQARWDERARLVTHGSAALLYGLLDRIVDNHFDTVQVIDDEIDAIEDLLFDESSQREVQSRTFRSRKNLTELRRVVLPMRDVVATLLRRDAAIETGEMLVYFDDVHDHVLRVIEWTESLRDMVTTVFETNLSLQDHRLNVVIKQLTSWAAIIAVPTLVTGFFGQNVQFPGEGASSGLFLSLGIIVVTSTMLYLLLRRRDWI